MNLDLPTLDRLVAEEIFGLVACPEWQMVQGLTGNQWQKDCSHVEGTCYPSGFPPKYSGIAFKKVIDVMLAEPKTTVQINSHTTGTWRVRFNWLVDDTPKSVMAESSVLEVAVCVAALEMQGIPIRQA